MKRAFLVAAAVCLLSVAVEEDGTAGDGSTGDGSTGDGAGFGNMLALAALAGATLFARRHGP